MNWLQRTVIKCTARQVVKSIKQAVEYYLKFVPVRVI